MSTWKCERVDLLIKLWEEGLPASRIAGRLGGVTRNAVISKIHRLGLSGRATTSRMKSSRPVPAEKPHDARSVSKPPATCGSVAVRSLHDGGPQLPRVSPAEELVIPHAERKTVNTLADCSCRWPIGDPQLADFHFCGKDKMQGVPYCEFHARRAFQPQPQKPKSERTERANKVLS